MKSLSLVVLNFGTFSLVKAKLKQRQSCTVGSERTPSFNNGSPLLPLYLPGIGSRVDSQTRNCHPTQLSHHGHTHSPVPSTLVQRLTLQTNLHLSSPFQRTHSFMVVLFSVENHINPLNITFIRYFLISMFRRGMIYLTYPKRISWDQSMEETAVIRFQRFNKGKIHLLHLNKN